MKKVIEKIIKTAFIFLFSLIVLPANAATDGQSVDTNSEDAWRPVINALIYVESKGNRHAKSGSSVGVLQITPILVAECNNILRSRRSRKRYKLSDRTSISKSIEMFLLIQSKYNPKNNIERAIRSWNGGINYSVRRTQRYFNKVMSALRNN